MMKILRSMLNGAALLLVLSGSSCPTSDYLRSERDSTYSSGYQEGFYVVKSAQEGVEYNGKVYYGNINTLQPVKQRGAFPNDAAYQAYLTGWKDGANASVSEEARDRWALVHRMGDNKADGREP